MNYVADITVRPLQWCHRGCENIFNWRKTTKRVHLVSSLAYLSLVTHYCVFHEKYTACHIIIQISLYFLKFDIRNRQTYSSDVSSFSAIESKLLEQLSFSSSLQTEMKQTAYAVCSLHQTSLNSCRSDLTLVATINDVAMPMTAVIGSAGLQL